MAGEGKQGSTGKGRVKVGKLTPSKETAKELTNSEAKEVRGGGIKKISKEDKKKGSF